jgi:FKBP-type peptidyl-prolyl cis-trans isomerase FkpA
MRILTTVLAASVLFLASCNKFEKTKSGMTYKITSAVSKEKIKQGDVVKLNLELKIAGKDTVLRSTYGEMPEFMKVDSARMPKHYFTEVINKLGKGDKMEFVLSVDTLVKLNMIQGYDKDFKKGGTVNGKVEILNIFKDDASAQADFDAERKVAEEKMKKKMEKESVGEIAKEKTAIDKYIADKKLNTVKTPGGVYVVIEKEGVGPKADSGKQVMVMYRGYTMDGKGFDKNMDADATHKDPIPVVLGAPGIIAGWGEGLKYFAKGSKGKLIVPFALGYGAQGREPSIPPYTPLVFDIEVVDITLPTPPAQMPAPQGQPQGH